MAESVVKLRIDSKEYDANIRRVGEALSDYMRRVREGGASLNALGEGVMEAVQALGQLGTKAEGTRGGLRELTQTLTDLTVEYRALTEEERNTPFGREMATAIDQLTDRAGNIRDAMGDVQDAINNVASDTRLFDQLSQGAQVASAGVQTLTGTFNLLGIDIGDNVKIIATLQSAMAVTNGLTTIQNALQEQSALMQGLSAAKASLSAAAHAALAGQLKAATVAQGALNLAMKAAPWMAAIGGITLICDWLGIFSSDTEDASDSQRSMNNEIQKGTNYVLLYVDALDSAHDSIIQYQDAIGKNTDYLELDKARRKVEELQKAFTEMYDKRAGNTASRLLKGESPLSVMNDTYYREDLQKISDELSKAENEVKTIEGRINTSDKALRHFLATWNKLDKKPEIQKAISAISNFRDQFSIDSSAYKRYDDIVSQLQAKISPKKTGGGGGRGGGRVNTQTTETQYTQADTDLSMELVRRAMTMPMPDLGPIKLTVEAMKQFSDASAEAEEQAKKTAEAMANMTTGTSITNSRGMDEYISMLQEQLSQADFGSSIYSSIEAQLADTSTLKNLLQQSMKVGLGTSLFDAMDMNGESIWEKVLSPDGVEDADWDAIVAAINAKREELDLPPIVLDVKTGDISETAKKVKSGWNDAAEAIRSVGNALSQIEDPTARVLGIIAEAIASITLGFAKAISAEAGKGVWAWIAAAAAGTATMISTIAAIKSATAGSYADGGIVPGNSYSGDRLTANVNSGELILSRAQQDSIAMQLQGSGTPEMHLTATITGEQIRLALNNNARRTGRGEYVTTRFT